MRKGWIRKLDGTADNLAKVRSQALRGMIWVAFWSPNQHRVFATRKEAEKAEAAWKRAKLAQGYRIFGFGGATWATRPLPEGVRPRDTHVFKIVRFSPDDLRSTDGYYNLEKIEV